MKKSLLTSVFFILILLSGCSDKEKTITKLSMLEGGKTFAIPTGTMADQFVLKKFPDAKLKYFNSALDCALAVKGGKADAAVYDKPVLQNIAGKNAGLTVLSELLFDDQYGFAVRMDDKKLKAAIDEVLADIKTNGTYEDMMKRWFPKKGSPAPMPDINLDGKNNILKFGTAPVTEPMSFIDASQKIVGFDIELAAYVAKKLNMQLEVINMEFGAMLPALISGKVNMIGAGLSITEERAKKVLFSECYYPSGIAAIVKDNGESVKESISINKFRNVDDIKNKRIGVLLGSVHDRYANATYPNAQILQYKSPSDILIALKADKIDAAMFDHVTLVDLLRHDSEFGVLGANLFYVPMGCGFNKQNPELREQFNSFLKEIKANGVYNGMVERWINKGIIEMPVIDNPKTNGQIKLGNMSDIGLPFTIVKNGKIVGFDIELSERFAAYIKKELVHVDMEFGSLIAALSTKKIDFIASSMMITEERKKLIDFSDPYYESGVSMFGLAKNIEKKNESEIVSINTNPASQNSLAESKGDKSFLQSITESVYSNIILEKRYLLIIDGLKITALISIFAALFGTVIGGLICFMRMSKRKLLSGFAKLYISLLRGTPVLVLLMIIYYVVFASVNINPALVAVLAFGLNFGAYVSEMFRTSIESIDKGQNEAGIAGGFTRIQSFIYIIMPQAARQVLPVYKGEFISLVKMTSIVGYIAVQDLTRASDIIRSRTFDAFFPLIMAAILYLLIAWLLTWALGYIEISVDPKRKRISSGVSK